MPVKDIIDVAEQKRLNDARIAGVPHDHVFRYHSVRNARRRAVSGPRL